MGQGHRHGESKDRHGVEQVLKPAIASRQNDELIRLFEACTVQVVCGEERGTGFFVAPDLVMTCAHGQAASPDRH